GDSDFDGFMSSLSYNWQNEFSDLRYQVDQLQKTDPAKYSALGASLGLKPGQQVQVPSQFSPQWASQFVMAAGLYTPPAPTFDPATATPTATAAAAVSVGVSGISISGLMVVPTTASGSAISSSDDGDDGGSESGSGSHGAGAAATGGLDSHHHSSAKPSSSTSESVQFGNPIAGNLNTADTPIVPTGIGYNQGTALQAPFVALLFLLALFI
ncbi:hypothetical protein IWW38_005503, partial [Coemansia aciculifera]